MPGSQCGLGKRHVQCNGINGVDLGKRHAAVAAWNAAVSGGKASYPALRTEEHNALIEHRKPRKCLIRRERLAAYFVKVGDVNRVIAAVETNSIHLHLALQKLSALRAHAERALYVGKRAHRGINAQILDAVLVAAGIHYLSRIDTNGLFYAFIIIDRTGHDPVCHKYTSQDGIEENFNTVYAHCSKM